jgi:hypothetical protein
MLYSIVTLQSVFLLLSLLASPAGRQAATAAADNALTPAETAQGWRLLFDGRTLDGWQPDSKAASWHVEDGTIAITVDAANHGDLRRTESLSDFQLSVDFWTEKHNSNSGVYLRCTATPSAPSGRTCYELNISDASDAFPTGSIVNVQSTLPDFRADTFGHWNTLDVTAEGNHFVVLLNGRKTVDAHDDKLSAGTIGLQGGGSGVIRFRNIKLRTITRP